MATEMTEAADKTGGMGGSWGKKFLNGIFWNWIGVVASFFTGFFLSPYIIHHLGDQRYGIWALVFAFIDYFMLFDLGFKAAVVNLVSRLRVDNQNDQINVVVSTALFYFTGVAALVLIITWSIAPYLHKFLKITPAYQSDFVFLIRIVGLGWASIIASNVFMACVEAFQRFKSQNHILIVCLILRSGGCALVILAGYGLKVMGVAVTVSWLANYILCYLAARKAFPAMRLSRGRVRLSTLKQLASYGIHVFVAGLGGIILNQGPPILVGHYQSEAFVGYYTLPSRLLQYVVELVTRIGYVTMPNTAELAATGRKNEIMQLGTYLNRYCLAIFLPLSVFLVVYGRELIRVWVGQSFSDHAAPLMPIFVISTTIAVAGQFNSSQILYGLAQHGNYSRALIVEGLLALAVMTVVLPRYGILGTAYVAGAFAILDRAIFTPFLLCRLMEFSLVRYLHDIYLSPLLTAVPVFAFALWMKAHWVSGNNWFQLIFSIAMIAVPYYLASYYFVAEHDHRKLLRGWIAARLA